jgi:hypothetical protein
MHIRSINSNEDVDIFRFLFDLINIRLCPKFGDSAFTIRDGSGERRDIQRAG